MRILVTGASGYVGRHLVPALLDEGHEVVAWGGPRWQPTARHPRLEARGVDLGAAPAAFADVGPLDAVAWMAQGPGTRDFPASALPLVAVNVAGLSRTLDLAWRAGARTFVYASTGNVYAPSFAPLAEDHPVRSNDLYAWTKLAGESLIRLYEPGLTAQVVRIFGIYGPAQRDRLLPGVLNRLTAGQPVFLEPAEPGKPDDGLRWTPCHVRDAVAVLLHLLRHPGESRTINLAGPETVSVAEVAREAGRLLNRPVTFERLAQPRELDLIADTARLRALLPRHRFVPFAEGLAETVAAFVREPARKAS